MGIVCDYTKTQMSIDAGIVLKTLLGGRRLSAPAASRAVQERVRQGLPAAVIGRLADEYRTSQAEIQRLLGIPRATAQRKRSKAGAVLDPVYSDRALRLARMLSLARGVFVSDENAALWFRDPNRALQGERPFDLLDTEDGADRVKTILLRIEHGVFS